MARYACALFAAAGLFVLTPDADARPKGDKPAKGKGGNNVEAMFKRLDTNSDGKLSKEEFAKMGEQAKGKGKGGNDGKGKGLGDQLFSKLDANSDGYLSLDEFKKVSELRKKKDK